MIDFGTLVGGPVQNIFARPIMIHPRKSQPLAVAYPARGVWDSRPIDIPLEDGAILSTATNTLLVRLSEYPVPPRQGDQVTVDGVVYLIDNTNDDGQGCSSWVLKKAAP